MRLDDRYTERSGPVLLSGIQALVRLMLDQRRLDAGRGLDTGVFVSGYQGSPLGGLDQELARVRSLLEESGIVFRPGLNEELAATAVGGTQLLGQVAGRTREGVTGFWYGKSPGLDRASDAIRHASFSGTAPLGGAVALVGDDPTAKSSTVPSACEPTCRSLVMPVLAPGDVAEIVELGLHAVALSRHAGLWTALKLVTELADSSGILEAGAAPAAVPELPARPAGEPPKMLPPENLNAERELLTERLSRVHEYGRIARLNRVVFEPERPRVGIVSVGIGHRAVVRALTEQGLDESSLEAHGVRLVRVSMPWPIEATVLRELVAGLETVLVVEDKLPFVEAQLKEALYRQPEAPLVLGKHDRDGWPLLPAGGAIGADEVRGALAQLLPVEPAPVEPPVALVPDLKRTPYFCSGCPHNTSTRAEPDQLVGAGIGCHTMVALDHHERRGHLLGTPQMGGEGAQWFGLAPFVAVQHFIQNMGDGTFHHSGSLAVRAAVAAGVNMTFRLLYNDAVAMTGGQQPQGRLAVPDLVALLAREGVRRVVVTTPEPERYRGVRLDPIAGVRHRDEFEAVQAELEAIEGVTVVIHDDRCATEKRRLRKRGALPTPAERVWINERVCEGCGDCGEQSSCLSVMPVATEYGRKTQIHQSSCNLDMSCVKGDCPSFVLVTPNRHVRSPGDRPQPPESLPEPSLRVGQDVLIRMPGVGGTGVVTAAAILRTAAFIDGLQTAGLDQTGLAQKGGPVLSDLRIATAPIEGQVRATSGSVDVLLGFDLLGCVDPGTLATLDPDRTVAVLNSDITPVAANVTDPAVPLPISARLIAQVRRATRAVDALALSAEQLSERLFGGHMQANLLLVGAAYQHGCLPLSAASIERAIELNGAAVQDNVCAFRWGRSVVADPAALDRALGRGGAAAPPPAPTGREALERWGAELTAYQDQRLALRYLDDVRAVAALEHTRLGEEHGTIADTYARGLFKLMAYKDEYEVARLHLDTLEQARLREQFGDRARVQVLLHPPLLRALGMQRKLRLGRSARPLFRLLRAGRRLRGTVLDPFGHTQVRRAERELIEEYRELVRSALAALDDGNAELVREIAALPELVRGYEQIKLDSIERMRVRAQELTAQLRSPRREPVVELPVVLAG